MVELKVGDISVRWLSWWWYFFHHDQSKCIEIYWNRWYRCAWILGHSISTQRCHPKASDLLLALPLLPLGTSMESESFFTKSYTAAETKVFLPKVSTCRGMGKHSCVDFETTVPLDMGYAKISLDQELATFWRQRLSFHEADDCLKITLGFITNFRWAHLVLPVSSHFAVIFYTCLCNVHVRPRNFLDLLQANFWIKKDVSRLCP